MFENNIAAQNILKKIVKVLNGHTWLLMMEILYAHFQNAIEETQERVAKDAPMEFLGKFLQLVCESQELEGYLCKERRVHHNNSSSPQQTHMSVASSIVSGI